MAVTGHGVAQSPYILTEPADFEFIRTRLSSHYRLGNDIDMSSYGNFTPIGNGITAAQRFTGVFNGNGFKIKNLKIRATAQFTGFITSIGANGIIENLALVNADVHSTQARTGSIVGIVISGGTLRNCYSSGEVASDSFDAGGVMGYTEGVVENCFSFCNVTSPNQTYGIGGIGSPLAARVNNCLFYGTLQSGASTTQYGAITSQIASNQSRSNYCYYDSKVIGFNNTIGIPLTTAELQNGTPFPNWNVSIWTFKEGKYPYLTSLGEPVIAVPAQKQTITVASYTEPFESYLRKSKRKVVTSATFTLPITQDIHRKLLTSCTSIVDEIVSSVVILKNANIKTHTVRSALQEISGYSQSASKAVRGIGSYIDPVASYIVIRLPEKVYEPVYAIAHFVVNPSMVQMEFNKSQLEALNNKSTADNLTGESVISHVENRTNIEVI